ncbi:MAG: PspC domain-containing protein [Sporichthyaceae bacterium]
MRMTDTANAGPALAVPPRYLRRRDGRLLAGVAGGLADHLRWPVLPVRIAFAILAGLGGFGLLLYAGYWAVVPQAPTNPGQTPRGLVSAQRLGLRGLPGRVRDEHSVGQLLALLALALGAVSLGQAVGLGVPPYLLWPALVVAAGLIVLWRQADEAPDPTAPAVTGAQSPRWNAVRVFALARFAGGVLLVGLGGISFLFLTDPGSALKGLSGGLVVVLGAALIAGPWLVRLGRSLSAERAERIRSQTHADLAAHLHDSVLQTLALIQRQAHDPREVVRLARGQERDLRAFLYADPQASAPEASFAAALREAGAAVEDAHGVPVEVVTVGDGPVDEGRVAVLAASREAMTNAAKHSGAAMVDVYAELDETTTAVYVRDRGRGFALADVPTDRAGIRHSIQGRVSRHGGTVRVVSAPGDGTEIEIRLGADS